MAGSGHVEGDDDRGIWARHTKWEQEGTILINNKSTASGGETPKGSAVSGVYPIPRELLDTRTTWFG